MTILKANAKTIIRLLAVLGLYALLTLKPLEQDEINTLLELTALIFLGVSPGLRAAKREDDK